MAKTTQSKTVVLMDDELFNLTWLIDYIQGIGLDVLIARTANEALEIIQEEIYRCLILDLNVPLLGPLDSLADGLPPAYKTFPGLIVAKQARNLGYRSRQVVVYSVHRDRAVTDETEKLDCTYILKGRPQELKSEIEAILSYDPTDS